MTPVICISVFKYDICPWLVWLSWLECHPVSKDHGFDSWSGYTPEVSGWFPVRAHTGGSQTGEEDVSLPLSLSVSLSLSLSLPAPFLPLSLKSYKHVLYEDFLKFKYDFYPSRNRNSWYYT